MFQFISLIVSGLVGLFMIPIVINLLGQEYYGVLEIIISLMFINFFFELGLGSTLLRFIPFYEKQGEEELNGFLWTYIYFKSVLAFIAALAILIIGYNFDYLFNIGQTDSALVKKAVYIFALGIITSNFATFFSNTLKGLQRFDFAILPNIISQIVFLILISILNYKRADDVDILFVSILLFIITPLIRMVLSMFFIKKTIPFFLLNPVKPEKSKLKESFSFLKGMSLISLYAQLYKRTPKMILGAILNPISVAYWAIAERLYDPVENIGSSLTLPLIPMASSMNLDLRSKVNDVIIRITKVHFLLIAGISSFILLYINSFIRIWLSEDYLQVSNIVQFWFLPFIFPNEKILLMFYYAKGKTKLSQKLNVFKTFAGLIIGTLLVFKFNAVGFAFGLMLTSLITSIIYFKYLCSDFYLSFWSLFKRAYLAPYIILGFTLLINYYLIIYFQISNWIELILSVCIGVVIYFILILLSLNKTEKKYYKNVVLDIVKRN